MVCSRLNITSRKKHRLSWLVGSAWAKQSGYHMSAPENQSTAATADTVESPCVMNSASSSWILTSGKSDSMLLHAWVQERRMSPVSRYPPNIPHDCCFKRGQQIMTVTRWVPFKYTQVSAQHEAPNPTALPWRGVSVIGRMTQGQMAYGFF